MVRKLQKEGEFPDSINLDEENNFDNDDNFQFDYDSDSSDSEENDNSESNVWWEKNSDNKEVDIWETEKINLDDI